MGQTYDFKFTRSTRSQKNTWFPPRTDRRTADGEAPQVLEEVQAGRHPPRPGKNSQRLRRFVDRRSGRPAPHHRQSWDASTPYEMVKAGEKSRSWSSRSTLTRAASPRPEQLQDNTWSVPRKRTRSQHGFRQCRNLCLTAPCRDRRRSGRVPHVTELSWTKHISKPSEVLKTRRNRRGGSRHQKEEQEDLPRHLQLEINHWESARHNYPLGARVPARSATSRPIGAFVEPEEGIDGIVHAPDMSWTRKFTTRGEVVKKGDSDAIVLDVDAARSASRWSGSSSPRSLEATRLTSRSATWSREDLEDHQLRAFGRVGAQHRQG